MSAPTCPRCGATMVAILYGFPAPDDGLEALVASGEVDYRGCVLPPGRIPVDVCQACGLETDRHGAPIEA